MLESMDKQIEESIDNYEVCDYVLVIILIWIDCKYYNYNSYVKRQLSNNLCDRNLTVFSLSK